MKKTITILALSVFLLGSVFAYTPTQKDKTMIMKVNMIVKSMKNEQKLKLKEKLPLILMTMKKDSRNYYILNSLLEGLNTDTSSSQKGIKMINKVSNNLIITSYTRLEYLIYGDGISDYGDKIVFPGVDNTIVLVRAKTKPYGLIHDLILGYSGTQNIEIKSKPVEQYRKKIKSFGVFSNRDRDFIKNTGKLGNKHYWENHTTDGSIGYLFIIPKSIPFDNLYVSAYGNTEGSFKLSKLVYQKDSPLIDEYTELKNKGDLTICESKGGNKNYTEELRYCINASAGIFFKGMPSWMFDYYNMTSKTPYTYRTQGVYCKKTVLGEECIHISENSILSKKHKYGNNFGNGGDLCSNHIWNTGPRGGCYYYNGNSKIYDNSKKCCK